MEGREFPVLDLSYSREERTVARAETGADGAFAIPLPRGRPFDLHATAEGFAHEIVRNRYAGEFVLVGLHRGAILLGKVTRSKDGGPVAGARLHGFRLGMPADLFRGETGTDGSFRLEGLVPGELVLEVLPPEGASPGWMRIRLEDGQVLRKDVVVAPGVVVTGRVTEAGTGRPIEGAEVGEGWTFRRTARTDASGRYAFPGFGGEGVSDLHVRAPGYGRTSKELQEPLRDPLDVDFELLPAQRAKGRILDSEGNPLPGTYVAAVASQWHEEGQKIDWCSSRTGPDGRFEIRDLRPDAPHALFVKRDGYGTAVYDFPFGGTPETAIDLGDVRLARPATIAGMVTRPDGTALPNVEVVLEGTNGDRQRLSGISQPWGVDDYVAHRRGRTDDRGRFSFADLAPGTYRPRPELPDRPRSDGALLAVGPGETREGVVVVVEGGLSIEGRVLDPEGRGVREAYLRVEPEVPTKGETAYGRTRDDGSFRIEGLGEGTYTVWAHPPARDEAGDRSGRLVQVVAKGIRAGATGVALTLPKGSAISGRVFDEEGLPLPKAWVLARDGEGEFLGSATTDAEGKFVLHLREGAGADLHVRPPPRSGDGRPIPPRESDKPLLTGVAAGTEGVVLELRGVRR
ncbi:MAG TPA: carboxypeptidase-like regulatory domain-containing protein [Planctomycetota bacterium]|nr:carboxypeptidase-like regulatory domain-containing protein [Planctomycetota bacterium]